MVSGGVLTEDTENTEGFKAFNLGTLLCDLCVLCENFLSSGRDGRVALGASVAGVVGTAVVAAFWTNSGSHEIVPSCEDGGFPCENECRHKGEKPVRDTKFDVIARRGRGFNVMSG